MAEPSEWLLFAAVVTYLQQENYAAIYLQMQPATGVISELVAMREKDLILVVLTIWTIGLGKEIWKSSDKMPWPGVNVVQKMKGISMSPIHLSGGQSYLDYLISIQFGIAL